MNDVSIRLEHVDLLNGLNWLHVHLLEHSLELLVIGTRALVDLLDLSSRGSLAARITYLSEPAHFHPSVQIVYSGHLMASAKTR